MQVYRIILFLLVSTHSRLKAAGFTMLSIMKTILCFNTQPPEGGWTAIKG